MGLLLPTSGSIEVDGIVINEQTRRSWQLHIAHVPQSIFLLDSSVTNNIAFGLDPDKIKISQVNIASQGAQIYETILNLPKQFDTEIGERGIRLSGGQRQRLGIARALYKDADLLVLDEATSALDLDTEQELVASIDALANDYTVLIIAHRLETLKNCDLVIEVQQDGSIKN